MAAIALGKLADARCRVASVVVRFLLPASCLRVYYFFVKLSIGYTKVGNACVLSGGVEALLLPLVLCPDGRHVE